MVFSQKLVSRYRELKRQAVDCVLLMQEVGVFMQVMDEDAREVSSVTGLKLQMAGDIDSPVVLGGFPQSGLDAYVGRLARAGHSVAIAMQNEQKERHLVEIIRVSEVVRPDARMRRVKAMLWKSNLPVAWIEETGRRLCNIAERAVMCRWAYKPDGAKAGVYTGPGKKG